MYNDGNAQYSLIDRGCVYVADGRKGLKMLNVSNPSKITKFKDYDLGGYCNSLVIDGNYTYIANGQNGVKILEIQADPISPPTQPPEPTTTPPTITTTPTEPSTTEGETDTTPPTIGFRYLVSATGLFIVTIITLVLMKRHKKEGI